MPVGAIWKLKNPRLTEKPDHTCSDYMLEHMQDESCYKMPLAIHTQLDYLLHSVFDEIRAFLHVFHADNPLILANGLLFLRI